MIAASPPAWTSWNVVPVQSMAKPWGSAVASTSRSEAMPSGLRDRLCRAVGLERFGDLEDKLSATKTKVHDIAVKKLHLDATEG